jgi:hypothetical protein
MAPDCFILFIGCVIDAELLEGFEECAMPLPTASPTPSATRGFTTALYFRRMHYMRCAFFTIAMLLSKQRE